MEPRLNPYQPGSGLRPPEMTGREPELEAFDTVIARTGNRLTNRGIILSGLRGVGKTVLLNELRSLAHKHEWLAVHVEAGGSTTGNDAVRKKLGRALVQAAREYKTRSTAKRIADALSSIGSFTTSLGVPGVSFGLTLAPGRADSPDLALNLEEMVQDVATALRPEGRALAIFVDELQDLDKELLSALITVQHRAGQEGWPFYVIGAGLPNLPAVLSDVRSYAERLFEYRHIGPLSPPAAANALKVPAERMGAQYAPEALALLTDATQGYPYFLQEYGKAIWDLAPERTFTTADAEAAIRIGQDRLDQGFYPSRWDRATPAERRFLAAMAEDGDAGSRTAEIARRLGKKPASLGPARASLIGKGLVYAPAHGQIEFTVPGMSAFIARQR
ncbi:AAA ATPase-like protein [Salana multivorans]|uniref:AAA ATPase-like protein n=1 Tax=Salana multivorans TaxID=120377 RepID=A0A3N2D0W8_9MICO|nr:ATP-binding protein [Salana multivorans]ROR93401.1 AAA ATPase-like protein [Salana multivorans]